MRVVVNATTDATLAGMRSVILQMDGEDSDQPAYGTAQVGLSFRWLHTEHQKGRFLPCFGRLPL